jgi:hypothetical protein
MRQTDEYYWAKKFENSRPEVVWMNYDDSIFRSEYSNRCYASDFWWISDEPIQHPKIPLFLKDNHYYVVEIEGAVASHKVVGRWSSVYKCFSVDGYTYGEATVKVVGGPFTADELVQIKPIE